MPLTDAERLEPAVPFGWGRYVPVSEWQDSASRWRWCRGCSHSRGEASETALQLTEICAVCGSTVQHTKRGTWSANKSRRAGHVPVCSARCRGKVPKRKPEVLDAQA